MANEVKIYLKTVVIHIKKMKRIVLSISILVVALFITGIYFDRHRQIKISLKVDDEINIHSNSIEHSKGVLILNDSIAVSGAARQYEEIGAYSVIEKDTPYYRPSHNKYIPILYDLNKPYRMIKRKDNDTLLIIKSNDTLYFKFIDPDYKDPNDPTFSDLFERLIKANK